MDFTLRACTPDDVRELREISYTTFNETFAATNTPEAMSGYMDNAYREDKLLEELKNEHSAFYFLYADNALAGYLKVNEHPAQSELNDPDSLEIERIYVKKQFLGGGVGQKLIDKAIEIAKSRGKKYVWLGVWEFNGRARRFYEKNGFTRIGEHSFFMGKEEQTDFILRKDLTDGPLDTDDIMQ